MNVVYVSDDNYSMLLGISLTSLYINNKSEKKLDVYIVDDGIGESNRRKILSTAHRFGREIFFVKPNQDKIAITRMGKWPSNVFYRLLLDILMEEFVQLDRAIYIDCDTIILESLVDLWNTNIEDKICAAVLECMDDNHKKRCGLKADDSYYNSGMILIDLVKWRSRKISFQMLNVIERNMQKKLEYPDEEIFNNVLRNQIFTLKPSYNITSIKSEFLYDELKMYRKSSVMYPKKIYEEVLEKAHVIHYTGNFAVRRPWFSGKSKAHKREADFLKYKMQSEWKKELLIEERLNIEHKIMREIMDKHRRIGICLASFLYRNIKPYCYSKLV